MGIWRMLYREARVILGFKPPAETPSQLCERLCGEVKGDIGGKKRPEGEDWFLEAKFEGREAKLLFEAAGMRAIIELSSSLEGGPLFLLVSPASQRELERGVERRQVTNGLFAEGKPAELDVMMDLWKALPTGTRGNLSSFVNKHKGELRYEDGLVRLTPEAVMLEGPSAKYNVKSVLQTLANLTGEMEKAWSAL
ncbi:MAG: hypothetical protein JNJ59_20635 [Deltaproteobacteria bacterium]|nr:hypothetical protein [Deltaproteobacteria bacterium]